VTVFHAGDARRTRPTLAHCRWGACLVVERGWGGRRECSTRARVRGRRPGSPGPACTTVATSRVQAFVVIPRYSLPEMAALFTDEGALRRVARGGSSSRARVGRPIGRGAGRRRRSESVNGRRFTVEAVQEAPSAVTDHGRSPRFVRRRAGQPWARRRADGCTNGLTSTDGGRHRALDGAREGPVDLLETAAGPSSKRCSPRRAPRVPGHADGRAHATASTPSPTVFGTKLALWAMQVRRDPRSASPTARRDDRGREAVGAPSATLTATSIRASSSTCATTSASKRLPRDASALARATVTRKCSMCARAIGTHLRDDRPRDPSPATHRGARGGRAVPLRRGRRAARPMPHKRNPIKSEQLCGLGAGLLRGQPASRASKTSAALARTRHLAQLRRAHRAGRLAHPSPQYVLVSARRVIDGLRVSPETHAREPRCELRARVQPAGVCSRS